MLASLGAPVTRLADVPDALRERRARRARTLIEPVIVAWNGRVPPLELSLVGPQRSGLATAAFHLEEGDVRSVHHDLVELPLAHLGMVEGEKVATRVWDTGLQLPLGYHRLRLTAGGLDTRSMDFRWAGELGNGWYTKVTGGFKNSGDFSISRNPDAITDPEYSEFCLLIGETD